LTLRATLNNLAASCYRRLQTDKAERLRFNMFKNSIFIVCISLLFQIGAAAQEYPVKVSYDTLLERVRKQDPEVNFQELRLAYTETKQYNPYGGSLDARDAMFALLNAKEYEKAVVASEKILSSNYLDINSHFVAYVANRNLKHAEKADYHKYVFLNLLKSISTSGDGKTMETAFLVISVDEEYALLNFMELQPVGQQKVEENGHNYDKMTAKDPKTKKISTYYFNVDKPFNWLRNRFK
jgi:hypothetical protein